MIGPERVRARRRGDLLELPPLTGKKRERALGIATELCQALQGAEGGRRTALEERLGAFDGTGPERKLASGMAKLLLDACTLSSEPELDPVVLRRAVFERASVARRALEPGVVLDRAATLGEVATALGIAPEALEGGLYADLKSEQRVLGVPRIGPEALLAELERAERQAVLLRAVRVTADVVCHTPQGYRVLFQKLKFRRLLHRIERRREGYRIEIDGPYSLFESVTKYGLGLALTLPVLEECDALVLEAELRWGPRREPCTFRFATGAAARGAKAAEASPPPRLPDDVRALIDGFAQTDTGWRAEPSAEILDLPGVGVCVPDLELTHRATGATAYLEVLGYWSRDAVWRRVELVERGLGERIVFAVSSRLRVSEEVIDQDASGALYVYKGTMSPRAIARRLDALIDQPRGRRVT